MQTWENANKEIWKNLSFCFAHLSPKKKRMFFKTNKSEKYIFSNVQKNQKMNVEGTIFEIFPSTERKFRKTKFGDVRTEFFDEKNLFERTRLENATEKKDESKKEKKN